MSQACLYVKCDLFRFLSCVECIHVPVFIQKISQVVVIQEHVFVLFDFLWILSIFHMASSGCCFIVLCCCMAVVIVTHKGSRDCWVRACVDRISQNLQSLSPYKPCPPTVFLFLRIMVKQVKSSSQISRYQWVNQY